MVIRKACWVALSFDVHEGTDVRGLRSDCLAFIKFVRSSAAAPERFIRLPTSNRSLEPFGKAAAHLSLTAVFLLLFQAKRVRHKPPAPQVIQGDNHEY